MKKIVLFFLNSYQKILSLDQGILVHLGVRQPGYICTFYPSCSQYAIMVIEKDGVFLGCFRSFKRILRCHPWQKNHIDFP